jgi:LmbE family N-acetylglucosaminyl deacetylase
VTGTPSVDDRSVEGLPGEVLVVSPHFDDAPLSLGQSLLDGALSTRRVSVAVVFGRTNWTRWVHPTPGRAPVVGCWRRMEETAAALAFGYRWRASSGVEAILRGVVGDDLLDPARTVDGDPSLPPLRDWLDAQRRPGRLVLVPAAIGGHVDHQLVARAGADLVAAGAAGIGFYEDRPYASFLSPDELAEQVSLLRVPLRPVEVSGPVGERCHRLLRRCYPSQLDDYFLDAMAADRARGAVERVHLPD